MRRTVVEFAEGKVGASSDLAEVQRMVDGLWRQFKPLAEALRGDHPGDAVVMNGATRIM